MIVAAGIGFVLGAGAMATLFAALDHHRQRVRCATLGFSARALADALHALVEDGELPYHVMQKVDGLSELAAAVARAVTEA